MNLDADKLNDRVTVTDLLQRPGPSNAALAAALGMKPASVCLARSGELKLPIAKAGGLAKVLGLSERTVLAAMLRDSSPEIWAALLANDMLKDAL